MPKIEEKKNDPWTKDRYFLLGGEEGKWLPNSFSTLTRTFLQRINISWWFTCSWVYSIGFTMDERFFMDEFIFFHLKIFWVIAK